MSDSHVRIGVSKRLPKLNFQSLDSEPPHRALFATHHQSLLHMSFDTAPPARIHSTTINQVQWCMLACNDPMDAFPPTVLSALAESIPLGLPTSGLCRWHVKAPWHPFTPPAKGTERLPWYLCSAIPSGTEQSVICREFQELESAIYELCQRYPEYGGPKPTPSELSFDSAEGFRQASRGIDRKSVV